MMKTSAAEEPGVTENERPPGLVQNQVVVFLSAKIRRLYPQFSGHAKMNADPIPAGKFEKHLFPPGERTKKTASR